MVDDKTPALHPARTMPFADLWAGMNAAHTAGMASRKVDQETGRVLFCYTNRCVYDNGWDDFSLMARGLILHPDEQRVVATPFPKFFNAGERGGVIPDLPFETFEKLDGSLAIIHHHAGRWRVATKGAFDSSQAAWAETRLTGQRTSALVPGTTYLAEAIYPENRIVIHYPDAALVMLAAYRETGEELLFDELSDVASALGWRTAQRHSYATFADLITDARALPATSEGFVLRFSDGLRLKVKGDEYRRIHALISRCTPLAMWDALFAGDDMEAIRRDLPEEFWTDFDAIVGILQRQIRTLTVRIDSIARGTIGMSDKEVGLSLATFPDDVRSFIFPWRKGGGRIDGKAVQSLFRTVRPTGNMLQGYVPSYAMNRVMEDAV
jgi:RNA ligase